MSDPSVNPSANPPAGRARYHHGDLRRDLLRVAREEIARNGAGAVSLASLARLAGVSQPAPYRHFADRGALLEGVAAAGFAEFADGLERAVAEAAPPARLDALSRAYLAFGEANIELYRLMFASRTTPDAPDGSDLDRAAARALAVLRGVLAPAAARVEEDVLLTWARLHGLVMLKADGFIARPLSSLL